MRVLFLLFLLFLGSCYTPKYTYTGWPPGHPNLAKDVFHFDTTGLWMYNRFYRLARQRNEADSTCHGYYARMVKEDIDAGRPFLLCASGPIEGNPHADSLFEQKYHVRLIDFGCIVGDNKACLMEYNGPVIYHLNGRYGPDWSNELYYHIIGMKMRKGRNVIK